MEYLSFSFIKLNLDPRGVVNQQILFYENLIFLSVSRQRRSQGGAMEAQHPPGPVKSMDFRGFAGPNVC